MTTKRDKTLDLNSRTDFRSCDIMVMKIGKWLMSHDVEFANCSVKQARKPYLLKDRYTKIGLQQIPGKSLTKGKTFKPSCETPTHK